MNQLEFGRKLVEIRKTQGLTQLELAEKCEVSYRTIQRIEAGKVTPRSFTIKTLSKALDFDFLNTFSNNSTENNKTETRSFILIKRIILQIIELFNLKTNTMKKLTFLSIILGLIGIGFFTFINEGKAQTTLKTPSFSDNSSIKTISKKEAINRIEKINQNIDFHNQSLKKLITYTIKSEYNYDTYVLIAELISNFEHSTQPAMKIAKIVFLTQKECDIFNDIVPLIFLHLSGPNDIYIKLAKQASEAKTENDISEIKEQIRKYKDQQEFNTLEEAFKNQ